MIANTISEDGAIVPLPVKKATKSSRRRAARKRAEAARDEAVRAPSCFSAPSENLVSFCEKLWLPDTLAMELSELGAFEPMHLIDLDESDKSSLTLKSLEMKRLVKAIGELAAATATASISATMEGGEQPVEALQASPAAASGTTAVVPVEGNLEALKASPAAASSAPSTSSFAAKAAVAPAVPSATGPARTKVRKASAAVKPPSQHEKQYSEHLVVGDPRLGKMNESDLLYLLREIPNCHFRARSVASSGRPTLTMWGTHLVASKPTSNTKKPSLSMTGKTVKLVKEKKLLSDITFGSGPFKEGETQFQGCCAVDAIHRCIRVGYRFPVCPTCNEAHLESKMAAHLERVHRRRHRRAAFSVPPAR